MDLKKALGGQIAIYESKKAREQMARRKAHDIELDRQMNLLKEGKPQCRSWGQDPIRGIINECKFFHESRWSPFFCTHSKVKMDTNPHWKGTSCENIGKDLSHSEATDNCPEWCPLR